MGLLDAGSGRYSVLLVELRQDWAAVRRLIDETLQIASLRENEPRPGVAGALVNSVALSLHHVYSALEASFERVAKYLDERVPQGGEWHAELLRQMSFEVPDLRPRLISTGLKSRLDEYRRFRHVVRKGYEHSLEWERMEPLVGSLPALREELEAAFVRFEQHLLKMIGTLNGDDPARQ